MPQEVTKKRKLDADQGRISASGSASKEVKKLQSDLKGCNTAAIIQALSDTLNDLPPENFRILNGILAPLLEVDAKPKHCVRCHKTFYEAENTRESCVVRCNRPERTDYRDDEYEDRYMRQTWCCGKMYSEGDLSGMESDDEDFVCYRAKHTTDTKSIKYYHEFLEEEGINYGGKNKAVRTCRTMRCAGKERGDRLPKVRNRAPTPFAR